MRLLILRSRSKTKGLRETRSLLEFGFAFSGAGRATGLFGRLTIEGDRDSAPAPTPGTRAADAASRSDRARGAISELHHPCPGRPAISLARADAPRSTQRSRYASLRARIHSDSRRDFNDQRKYRSSCGSESLDRSRGLDGSMDAVRCLASAPAVSKHDDE